MGPASPHRLATIVVAHDGSPGGARAADRAAQLPLAQGASVHFVHVTAPSIADEDRAQEALHGRARAARDVFDGRGRGDVEVLHTLLEGSPHEELIRYARVHGAELLVLGRHGDTAHGEPSVGSTALQLIRHGGVPLLVAVKHDEAARPFTRPVVAVDLSDASRQVVELALALLPEPAPTLAIVHALHVPFQGRLAWALSKGVASGMKEEAAREARSRVERFVDTLRPLNASAEVAIAEGETSLAVVHEVVRRAADLLVVGTHGRSGLKHAIFGSVAEWIVAAVPCDVAVTRPTRRTFDLP